MKDITHTPGPWEVVNGTDVYPIGDTDGRFYVAHCDPDDAPLSLAQLSLGEHEKTDSTYERQMANARLIAAAPDLLEALRYARRFLKPADHDTAYIDRILANATSKASPNLPSASQEGGE